MLCFVVLNVTVAEKSGNSLNRFFGLAIGFVVIAGAYGAGAVSGGAFNPTVAIGIDVSSANEGSGKCALYTFVELFGGALAAVFSKLVRVQEFGEADKNGLANYISEFLGTYFVVLTVGLAAAYGIMFKDTIQLGPAAQFYH